jgi:LacI family transcriptional regulator
MQVLRRVADTRAFPFASFDYPKGGRLATEHLVVQGERDIAFVGGLEGRPITGERMSGYLEVMAEHGLSPRYCLGQSSRAFGRQAALALAREAPECRAAVCFNDLVALGMMSGFAESGGVMGQNFRLVGFDDIEEAAQAFPALSSVHCDVAGFGERIAATMLSWLEDGRQPPPEHRDDVELVARASSLWGQA